MKKYNLLIIFTMCLGLCLFPSRAWADLSINLFAVNGSERDVKKQDLKYYLPKELEPEDIVDTGPLKVEYDVDKKLYYVFGNYEFQPKESRAFKIKVKDVWVINPEEITILKDQVDKNLGMLPKDENYPVAQRARDKITQELDFLLSQQAHYSQDIERRIEEYRAYRDKMEEIRNNVFSLDFLRHDSKALEEMASVKKTVKFVIEVKNPSAKEEKTVQEKHYLPDEVRESDVLEKQGFDVRFDEKKNRTFLTKEEVFKPGEMKRYEIIMKDIWQFPLVKADDLIERALIALGELEGTIFEESGNFLKDRIAQNLNLIKESQAQDLPVQKHIGMFRINQKRYQEAWNDFKRIEEMIAIVRAKKLEELESKKVKNVLQRLKALRGLQALSEALFKKSISVTVTWRIIMGTIIFLAFFTTLHFMIWARRSRVMGEEKGPPGGEGIKVVPKPGSEGEAKET